MASLANQNGCSDILEGCVIVDDGTLSLVVVFGCDCASSSSVTSSILANGRVLVSATTSSSSISTFAFLAF